MPIELLVVVRYHRTAHKQMHVLFPNNEHGQRTHFRLIVLSTVMVCGSSAGKCDVQRTVIVTCSYMRATARYCVPARQWLGVVREKRRLCIDAVGTASDR
jgi:hypothetical protein